MTHGHEKSGPAVVAMKPANKAGASAAEPVEPVERRAGAEGNANQQRTHRAPNRDRVTQALERGSLPPDLIRWTCREAQEEGTVHRAPPPRQPRDAANGVLRAPARSRSWRGWGDMGGLRGRPRAQARGPARTGPSGSLSAAAVTPGLHPEGGWTATTAGDRGAGGQGLSPDLIGGSSRARPPWC